MAHRFTNDQIAEYREAFNLFDTDGKGCITEEELGGVIDSLGGKGAEMSPEELHNFVVEIDTDGNGTIEFNEFLDMLAKIMPEDEEEDECSMVFHVFDNSRCGLVGYQNMKAVFNNIGEIIGDEDINAIIKQYDRDNDNKLSFSEFKTMFEDNMKD